MDCARGGRALLFRGLLAATGIASASAALAQVPPGPAVQVPADVRQAVPSREQVETPSTPSATPSRSASVEAKGAIPAGPCPLQDSTVRVALSKVVFEAPGGGALDPALAALLAPVGTVEPGDKPIAVVCEIRDRANQALIAAGYVASVQIPPQEIGDGGLRLVVVTAHITEVRVSGASGRLAGEIATRVRQIKALDPLNAREAERILLLANDIPGLRIRLTLRPAGTGPGDVIGDLTVDATTTELIANYQNTGSRQLGPSIFSARGEIYGLTGLADRTFLGVSNAAQWDEVHVLQGGHDMALGSGGARIGGRASYAWSNPSIQGLDLRSRSLIAGLDLSAPLYRALVHRPAHTRDYNIYAGAGLEVLNQRTVFSQNGTDTPFTRDRLRVFYARAGAHVRTLDNAGVDRWDIDALVELRKGASILKATKLGSTQGLYQPSRLEGDPDAFEARATLDQTVQASSWLAFDLSAFGQWSNKPLLNLEEFTLGNLTYGRGYDPGANGGDRAVALHFEPRIRVPVKGPVLELTGFFDAIRIWNLDSYASTGEKDRQFQSAGGGIRITWPRLFVLDLTYARPLDRALVDDKHKPRDRVLLTFTTQLLPWRAGR